MALEVNEGFVAAPPSHENAIALFQDDWSSSVPGFLSTGPLPLFDDARIAWLCSQTNLSGNRVLELGPLEAGHTAMMLAAGAASVLGIEANAKAYLRCLVVKEALGLDRAHFLLGDFAQWLRTTTERYDAVLASGVLYHMVDPIGFLEMVTERTDKLMLWTHFVDDNVMPEEDPRRGPIFEVEQEVWHGYDYRLHRRTYLGRPGKMFTGGVHSTPTWLDRATIIHVLKARGFTDIRIAHETPDHPNGPAACIFAGRP